jgi:zinc D-Ala-D-Ala carboxypeptidase
MRSFLCLLLFLASYSQPLFSLPVLGWSGWYSGLSLDLGTGTGTEPLTYGEEEFDDLFAVHRKCTEYLKEKPVQLSKNFSLVEFTRSETAARLGISNTPTRSQIDLIELFAKEVLQPLRNSLGPVRISSGYRSPELNERISGSPSSAHKVEGGFVAADIQIPGWDLMKIISEISRLELPVSQVILEPSWVHVSSHHILLRGPSYLKARTAASGRTVYDCLEWGDK